VRWFGPAPFSNACLATEQASTPQGVCAECERPFAEADCGYLIPGPQVDESAYHAHCFVRMILPPEFLMRQRGPFTFCMECGAFLMGGATKHAAECGIGRLGRT
jgi:hypothetical protein